MQTGKTQQKLKGVLLFLMLLVMVSLSASADQITVRADKFPVKESGRYSSMEEVAVYLATFGRLPDNYITKKEAQALGWKTFTSELWDVAEGYSIGGDRYGNYEGVLPDAWDREWTECDIDFNGKTRNAKRIVFSNDGLIYYTEDHYNSFDEINVVFNAKSTEAEKKKETDKDKEIKASAPAEEKTVTTDRKPEYGQSYTDWEDVAAYLLKYHELPVNYISLNEAKSLGFDPTEDNMGEVAPEFTIGGRVFKNREKLLPEDDFRTWNECDVDTVNGKRGTHRLVYSSDGLVYLTRDQHKSFVRVEVK